MGEIDFQRLYELLDSILPDAWNKVVFRAEYLEGSYSMKYYVKDQTGKYIDCYNLQEITEDDIVKAYIEIDKILYPERQKLAADKRWSVFTFSIDSDGSFKSEFLYNDIDEDYCKFVENWKSRYLV
ncbi:immunity protein YezG family protein [Butyrivibrio sp. AE2032]|uniref:immunity protein YezG family protein n=1 Tax=Butyrivibrio sp. AE2032 TaxID=1458463 RepID=UPI00055346F8|nr:immunity protein YezG family protein [Butyrivibrio sp. AE2032]